jgi:hypothetical protein
MFERGAKFIMFGAAALVVAGLVVAMVGPFH